jgi:hypothetical protein
MFLSAQTDELVAAGVILTGNRAGAGAAGQDVGGAGGDGGALWTEAAWALLSDIEATGNAAGDGHDGTAAGAGGAGGALVLKNGSLSCTACALLGNQAGRGGDGAYDQGGVGGAGGAVRVIDGALRWVDSALVNNVSGDGGYAVEGSAGGRGSAIAASGSSVELTSSAVIGNTCGLPGVGPWGEGVPGIGAIYVAQGSALSVVAATVSGNHNARIDGVLRGVGGGIVAVSSDLSLLMSTVTDNHATEAGGLLTVGGADRMVRLQSSIVAGNEASEEAGTADCAGDPVALSAGGNLFALDTACPVGPLDTQAADPGLLPLDAEGDAALYHGLAAGSAALGHGLCQSAHAAEPIVDQLGHERPAGACDAGAVESL